MKGGRTVTDLILRRSYPPFNSKKFCLDLENGILHDLDFEKDKCHIGKIEKYNIFTSNDIFEIIVDHECYKSKCPYCG